MTRTILGFALAVAATAPLPALAQAADQLTPDQRGYIAYDRCMMHAAMEASRTEAKDEEVFGLAKAQCAATRAQVVVGREGDREYLAALDAADVEKAANFPAWIKGVRERRRARETR